MAFPASRLALEGLFGAGEQVACRFQLQGRHLGPFQGIPATGKPVSVPGITILEFRDERCIRRWSCMDSVGLLVQLGAFPSR